MSYNAYRKKDQAIDPAQAMQRARGKFAYDFKSLDYIF